MKKKRSWKFYVLIVFIVLVLVVAGFAAAVAMPKDIGVNWTNNDFKSGISKITALKANQPITKGEKVVRHELSLTSEELSGVLSETNIISTMTGGFMPKFKYVKVKILGSSEVEAVFQLEPSNEEFHALNSGNFNKQYTRYFMDTATRIPVYTKMTIEKTSPNSVNVSISEIRLGQVPVTDSMLKMARNTVNSLVNNYINRGGINVGALELDNNNFKYKGDLPVELIDKLIN